MTSTATSEGNRLIQVDAPALGHLPVFDGIRGLLLPIVVFYHAHLATFLGGGPIIIDLFFVLSGFLITSLLLDERNKHGAIGLRNFYTRRVLRLFPAMYLMLAVFSIVAIIVVASGLDENGSLQYWWVDTLGSAFYVYNIVAAAFPDTVTGAIGHTWSLSVEEQFYFIWPLLLVAVLKRSSARSDRRLIIGSVIFIVAFFAIRGYFQDWAIIDNGEVDFRDIDDPTWQGFLYRFASSRPDMIVFGCLAAFVARKVPRPIPETLRKFFAVAAPAAWVWFLAVVTLGNSGLWGFDLWGGPAYQLGLVGLGVMTLDLYFRQDTWYGRAICWKPLRWLGLRTYGIYLWHVMPLWIMLPTITSSYGVQRIVLGLIASALGILAGLASFKYIERPFLGMKKRFEGPGKRQRREQTPESDPPAGQSATEPAKEPPATVDLRVPSEAATDSSATNGNGAGVGPTAAPAGAEDRNSPGGS